MEPEITYQEFEDAKDIVIQYLKKRRDGYEGADTWERYSEEYLALIALSQLD